MNGIKHFKTSGRKANQNQQPRRRASGLLIRQIHNYERSLGNNKVLAKAGIQDTPDMNQKIAEKILEDAKKVTTENTSIESRFKRTKKDVIIESKWIPNIEGPYCTTIIIKEVK